MEQLDMAENVDTLFRSLESFTQKEGVIGKPVTQGEKTFLPVVSVTVGYGGGNMSMKGQQTSGTSVTGSSGMSGGSGSGALGLGAKLNTEAIIVIDNQDVSMMPMSAAGASQLIEKIPQIVSGMQGKQQQGQQGQSGMQGQGSSYTSTSSTTM
ncbi:MAG TPA: spore germination protein GerW family protein [Ruminiclostridium sp.]|nr:spore germination protein GerW family protein [Ruminiclostridium sp.]